MVCNLTYKNLRFDNIEQLSKFIKLEGVVSKIGSLEDVSNNNLRNIITISLVSNTDVKLQNTYNSSDINGLIVEELYDEGKENSIINKFDSCYGRGL